MTNSTLFHLYLILPFFSTTLRWSKPDRQSDVLFSCARMSHQSSVHLHFYFTVLLEYLLAKHIVWEYAVVLRAHWFHLVMSEVILLNDHACWHQLTVPDFLKFVARLFKYWINNRTCMSVFSRAQRYNTGLSCVLVFRTDWMRYLWTVAIIRHSFI